MRIIQRIEYLGIENPGILMSIFQTLGLVTSENLGALIIGIAPYNEGLYFFNFYSGDL